MPRRARVFSRSGYMHIIIRGVGRQILFEDNCDYRRFLATLERYCLETGVRICAYCLMENHVHLLVWDHKTSISLLMKKVGVSYSRYFNKKYERTGHLLQDRYLSEIIEGNRNFLMVFRYILKNPQKAGICKASEYPWSSYALYEKPLAFMELSQIHELLGDQKNYEEFINETTDDRFMEYETHYYDDKWAQEILCQCLNIKSGTTLQTYDRKERNLAIRLLKSNGLTNRQIERLTGISRNIVQRA